MTSDTAERSGITGDITRRELALKALRLFVLYEWVLSNMISQNQWGEPGCKKEPITGTIHQSEPTGEHRTTLKRGMIPPQTSMEIYLVWDTCLLRVHPYILSECLLKSTLSLLNTSILLFSRWVLLSSNESVYFSCDERNKWAQLINPEYGFDWIIFAKYISK